MPNKQEVIDAHRLHPGWTSKQIAIAIVGPKATEKHVYAINGWVRAVAEREGLTLGKIQREPKPAAPAPTRERKKSERNTILALGQVARALNLTVGDLVAISKSKSDLPQTDASIEDIGAAMRVAAGAEVYRR